MGQYKLQAGHLVCEGGCVVGRLCYLILGASVTTPFLKEDEDFLFVWGLPDPTGVF